jgi:hypothetical protein
MPLRANLVAPTVNIKLEAQHKKLITARGSYTDLYLSIHVKKEHKKSHETLPLTPNIGAMHKEKGELLRKTVGEEL